MKLKKSWYLMLWLIVSVIQIQAQQSIRINEVMASNIQFLDEDGDTPDWIELLNDGDTPISLKDWSITDNFSKIDKWVFSDIRLQPNQYLLIWASDKDKRELAFAQEIVTEGTSFKYIVPNASTNQDWKSNSYDDSSWQVGISGFGYADGDDNTLVPSGTRSVFLRHSFIVDDTEDILQLILHMDYDDGFVAYLNATEIARSNIEGSPPRYNATTLTDREALMHQGQAPEKYMISDIESTLLKGKNTLAIQVHNVSTASSDMSAIAFLTALSKNNNGNDPEPILDIKATRLHTNFKISASSESIYLFDDKQLLIDSIVIDSLASNVSIGLDENNELTTFTEATPGSANVVSSLQLITDTVQFSLIEEEMSEHILLRTSSVDASHMIRYTTDSSYPTEFSRVYSQPLVLNKNTVIRARIFADGSRPSDTQTQVYLRDITHDLPVLSLVTESNNFYDIDTGIYVLGRDYESDFPNFGANFWEDIERPVHVSFLDDVGNSQYQFDAGVKIFGGWSRAHSQRSLSIFARKRYGVGKINYPIFKNLPYQDFEAIVLRNSGNDWPLTMCRDAILTGLMSPSNVDIQAYQPVATYLNGNYFGLYNLREKINEHSLASKHQLDPDDITILEKDGEIIKGENDEYLDLIKYVSDNNMVNEHHYTYARQRIDIDNYIQYQVAQIFFDNTDWPGNNIKFWNHKKGKWRWILFDTDFGFGIWDVTNYTNNTLRFALANNGPNWPNPPWSTILFRSLIDNQEFKQKFINQYADELNSRFLSSRVKAHIDSTKNLIASEIPKHKSRWSQSVTSWNRDINTMKIFATQRTANCKDHIKSVFNLPSFNQFSLNISDSKDGYVRVNSLKIDQEAWSGDYFATVPILLRAIPKDGYAFSHWEGDLESTNPEESVNINKATSITAVFIPMASEPANIVINEINYNSSDDYDTQDWVELYNPRDDIMDISDWIITDDSDKNKYIIKDGTTISPKGYIIVTHDLNKFEAILPTIRDVTGNFSFGLSKNGDAIKVYNDLNIMQDSVSYLSESPWPEEPTGGGSTLELIDPALDNSLPENWARLHANGSPGKTNLSTNTADLITDQFDIELFPNPFTSEISVTLHLKNSENVQLDLYNLSGIKVDGLLHKKLTSGYHQLDYNLDHLSEGAYLLQLTIDDLKSLYKIFKVK